MGLIAMLRYKRVLYYGSFMLCVATIVGVNCNACCLTSV